MRRYIALYFKENERDFLLEMQAQMHAGEDLFVGHGDSLHSKKRRAKVLSVAIFDKPDELRNIGWMKLDFGPGGRWPELPE